jgi:hypothetical protein
MCRQILLQIINRNFTKTLSVQFAPLYGEKSKVLRIITDAPWYVPNTVIKRDLKVLSVRQAVRNYSMTFRQRLNDHPNRLAKSLFQRTYYNRRLKRYYPADLATRF